MNNRNSFKTTGLEFFTNLTASNGLPPIDLEGHGVFATLFGDIKPLIGKCTTETVKNFARANQISNGSFHHAPSAGRRKKNRLDGSKEFLETRMNRCVKVFKTSASMSDHRLGKSCVSLRRDLDGTWYKKFGRHNQRNDSLVFCR